MAEVKYIVRAPIREAGHGTLVARSDQELLDAIKHALDQWCIKVTVEIEHPPSIPPDAGWTPEEEWTLKSMDPGGFVIHKASGLAEGDQS